MKLAFISILLFAPTAIHALTIKEAKRILADSLKDPASAQFRNVKAYKSGAVCGEYNARNGFGGYVGFKRFGVAADGSIMDAPDVEGLDPNYAAKVLELFESKCGAGGN